MSECNTVIQLQEWNASTLIFIISRNPEFSNYTQGNFTLLDMYCILLKVFQPQHSAKTQSRYSVDVRLLKGWMDN